MMGQKSTVEAIRNNQAIRGSYNGIVMMQTTQTQYHKQRKRDNANNANVIMASCRAHNAIVISRFHRQAFVTLRNISSAYHSHKLSLLVQTYYVTIEDWHKCRCTISSAYVTDRPGLSVQVCYYAAMGIQRYRHMSICGWAHNENDSHYHSHAGKIDQEA